MQLYIYCQTGHNFGLENLRRSSAIYKKLQDLNPILATADYRAATFAKSELGVSTGLGVDIIENLPHMMTRRDILIFDSHEPSDTTKEYMKEFCTHLFEVGVDIPYDIVDDTFFQNTESSREKAIFFADDDYEDDFLNICQNSKQHNIPLLLGHYFFLGHEDKLKPYFSELFEDEDYEEVIKNTKYLLTSSVHSCLESLASGNKPVFFPRNIKQFKGHLQLLEKYNIPIIYGDNLDILVENFENIIKHYPQTKSIEPYDLSDVYNQINNTLKKFEGIV